jgi:hypothetical protein
MEWRKAKAHKHTCTEKSAIKSVVHVLMEAQQLCNNWEPQHVHCVQRKGEELYSLLCTVSVGKQSLAVNTWEEVAFARFCTHWLMYHICLYLHILSIFSLGPEESFALSLIGCWRWGDRRLWRHGWDRIYQFSTGLRHSSAHVKTTHLIRFEPYLLYVCICLKVLSTASNTAWTYNICHMFFIICI